MELEIENKREKGLTLVELLVAMAVFGIIISLVINIAFSVIKAQRKAFAIQNVQESARFLLEVMSKEIRTSLINTGGGSGLTTLNITNAESETLDYQFDNTNKVFLRDGQQVSPDTVSVTGAFYIQEYSFPSAQPRKVVTIVMKVEASGNRAEEASTMNLQSSVAPRTY